ncbi:MAG: hypothetical protein KDD83_29940, partial [Caldilineaceae bacterium]|nr:hypothetical protein [Caldilineaceae bacterium]
MQQRSKLFVLASLLIVLVFAFSACAAPVPAGTEAAPAADDAASDGAADNAEGGYVIGVSNTLVGNGWREQMICAIKAEATASGLVDRVVVVNRNGGP